MSGEEFNWSGFSSNGIPHCSFLIPHSTRLLVLRNLERRRHVPHPILPIGDAHRQGVGARRKLARGERTLLTRPGENK